MTSPRAMITIRPNHAIGTSRFVFYANVTQEIGNTTSHVMYVNVKKYATVKVL